MHQLINNFGKQLENVLHEAKQELLGVRANRPTTALLENLPVTYYGQTAPMKHVASISVLPPREIIVQAWDREAIAGIVKAIESSSLGLQPQADGNTVHVRLPELSAERREELVRHVKKLMEQHRIRIRHLRDEANKEVQKLLDGREITEDQKFSLKEEIQKQTEQANKNIDAALESKIKEIQE